MKEYQEPTWEEVVANPNRFHISTPELTEKGYLYKVRWVRYPNRSVIEFLFPTFWD